MSWRRAARYGIPLGWVLVGALCALSAGCPTTGGLRTKGSFELETPGIAPQAGTNGAPEPPEENP